MSSQWRNVVSVDELNRRGKKIVRVDDKQIVLFQTQNGLLACNNRCPHEGYPLAEGMPDEHCVLTCHWHNWKFDLKTGNNLYGGDRLRIYPSQIRGSEIWLDVADPPLEQQIHHIKTQFQDAFDDNAYARMAREIGRLLRVGADPLESLVDAILLSWERLEFGWTHAYAAMAEWLVLYDEHRNERELQIACLLESVAHVADDVLREQHYPYPTDILAYDEDQFVQAIEDEDQVSAIALVRGGFNAGLTFRDLEKGLTCAALAHYNDFGHALIYVSKAGRLIERLGARVAEPLTFSLVRGLIFATREDQIPEFRHYQQALAQWDGAKPETEPPVPEQWRGLGIKKALDLALAYSGAQPEILHTALLGANAWNMLAFNDAQQDKIKISVADNVGWLDFTHGITFAKAVHEQCTKFPELWPQGLLQMSCFCGRNAPFTKTEADLDAWRVTDTENFYRAAIQGLFDHGRDEFIVSAHLLKTTLAARALNRWQLPDLVISTINAALNRFLHSPLKRKQVQRTVFQALKFVASE